MEPIQVNSEFIQWFTTLGIGGVLAGFMFMFYRKDVKQYTELWKMTAEQFALVIKENTTSNTKLITLLEALERNSLRKQDIEIMLDRRSNKSSDRQSQQGYRQPERT